jgi:hypothetical protein
MMRLVASPEDPALMLTQARVVRPGGVPPVQLTVRVAVVSTDVPGRTSTLPKLTFVMLTVQVDDVPPATGRGAISAANPASAAMTVSGGLIGRPPAR